jgi:hypothetical protein
LATGDPTSNTVVEPDESESSMSPFNQQLASILINAFKWIYFLWLLLMIIWIGYRIWRKWRKKTGRGRWLDSAANEDGE